MCALMIEPTPLAIGQRIDAIGRLIPDEVMAKRIFPDDRSPLGVVIVMDNPIVGFRPSVPPSIDQIPNNHRAYAVQWFLFAAIAAVIFLIALRRRNRATYPQKNIGEI